VGRGRPYHFLSSLFSPEEEEEEEESSSCRHGIELESLVDRAYERLTGRVTRQGGFWVSVGSEEMLGGLIGASPDALVYNSTGERPIVLAEYKAPVYKMYTQCTLQPHGVPRVYMAQVQGQMSVCEMPWCDFMVVCEATREMSLQRIHFSPHYRASVRPRLRHFCLIVQTARVRQLGGLDPLNFPEARDLKSEGMSGELFEGEADIRVENLLVVHPSCALSSRGSEKDEGVERSETLFKTHSGTCLTFDQVMCE